MVHLQSLIYKETKWFQNECREKKTEYHKALRLFNINKTGENRNILCKNRKGYTNIVRRKNQRYENYIEIKSIDNLKGKKPKQFW